MRQFQHTDTAQIKQWLHDRRLEPFPYAFLPDTGFIVDDVACGFLLTTNSKIAYLEFFFSNPNAPKDKRREAIKNIASALITYAKANKYKIIRIDSKVESILNTAKSIGFKPIQTTNLYKEI